MSLLSLFSIPKTPDEWRVWSFSNQDSHNRIAEAVHAQKKTILTILALDPIPQSDLAGWLRNHQQMHNEMDSLLNIDSTDLTVPDPSDQRSYSDFVFRHAREHQQAENILGIG